MSHLYFEIHANDLGRAQAFYESLFAWSFEKNPHAPLEYFSIETGRTLGGLLQRPGDTPPPECGTNAYVCSIEVDNFDQTAEKIETLGGQVALPKFAVTGKCWQGYFLAPEGNTFGIFEMDENAE